MFALAAAACILIMLLLPGLHTSLANATHKLMCVTLQGLSDATIRAIEAPAASAEGGPVSYPRLPGLVPAVLSGPVDEYAAYPEVSTALGTPSNQRTELFMDYYSDVSR